MTKKLTQNRLLKITAKETRLNVRYVFERAKVDYKKIGHLREGRKIIFTAHELLRLEREIQRAGEW